jgi:diguanylate cyclase (GGDEF)-like protein/PAS domain S-box-containing protein
MPRWFSGAAATDTGRRGLAVLLVAYVVLIVTVAGLVYQSRLGERDALRDRTATRIASIASEMSDNIPLLTQRLVTIAERRLAGEIDARQFRELAMDQGFAAALVLDSDARLLAYASEQIPLAEFGPRQADVRVALSRPDGLSDVIETRPGGLRLVAFTVPFKSAAGEPRVLSVVNPVGGSPLSQFLQNISSLPTHRAYLYDAQGALVAREAAGTPPLTLRAAEPELSAAVERAPSGTATIGDRDTYYTSAPVPGTSWRLLFAVETAQLYAPLDGPGQWVPWVVLAAFTVTGLMAIGIANRFHQQGRRLAESEGRSRSILSSTPDAFIGIDGHSIITDWNPAAEALLGWPAEEVLGRPAEAVYVPEHLRAVHAAAIAGLAAGDYELPTGATTFEVKHRDGRIVPVELVASAVPRDDGWLVHAFLRDLTPRLTADRELRALAGIVAATTDAVLSKRLDGTIMTWNPASERLYGWTADEMVGRGVEVLVPEEKQAELQAIMHSASAGIPVPPFETVRRRKDGTLVDVSLSVSPLLDGDGTVIGACATARDITQSLRQAAELREAEELFRLAFDAVPVGMGLTSLRSEDRGRLLRVNGGLCWMLGYTAEELLRRTFMDITHPDDVEAELEMLTPFLEGRQRTIRFEKRYVRGDGSTVWAMVSSAVVDGPDGRPRYAVTQVEDITARRAEQERLTALALADPLTGLANRLLFDDRLAQAVHRAGRHDRTIAIVYCDLDHFKPVNDQFGHAVGDELLRQVGHRLMVAMRPSDTVARLGGDEFAVICEDLPNADTALAIADRVRATVEGTYLVSAGAVRIGCSVGVATAHGAHIESRELVARADLSMFSDKRTRRSGDPLAGLRHRREATAREADLETDVAAPEPVAENATPSS